MDKWKRSSKSQIQSQFPGVDCRWSRVIEAGSQKDEIQEELPDKIMLLSHKAGPRLIKWQSEEDKRGISPYSHTRRRQSSLPFLKLALFDASLSF